MEKWGAEEESAAGGGRVGEGDPCTLIKGWREDGQAVFVKGISINLNYVRLDRGLV